MISVRVMVMVRRVPSVIPMMAAVLMAVRMSSV